MSREVAEWIGAKPNTAIPPRVQLRVWGRDGGRCKCGCNRPIRPGESWQIDHTVALINEGQNRESNLRLILTEHHKPKTAQDVAEKAAVNLKRAKHIGVPKRSARPIPGSKASGLRKRMDGRVERW